MRKKGNEGGIQATQEKGNLALKTKREAGLSKVHYRRAQIIKFHTYIVPNQCDRSQETKNTPSQTEIVYVRGV